jgi:hypothetical protein
VRAPGGWTVEVVRDTGTGNRDGEWLRLRQYGYWTADVRSVAELAEWLELASLEEDTLTLMARSALVATSRSLCTPGASWRRETA